MNAGSGSSDSPVPDPTGAFRFGRFELHPAARLLLRDGQPVELQAKVFDFIAYLLAHRGRAVEKNELLDAVWPRQVVTEAALSRCVMKARRAVDDEADDPAVILTVHGRGYRFIAAVEPILERRGAARSAPEPEAGEPAADDTPARPAAEAPEPPLQPVDSPPPADLPPASSGRRARTWLLAGLAALLLALAGGWWMQQRAEHSALPDGPVRVAVLPVENATGESRYDWARLGLMEALTETLRSQVPVVPPGDVFDLTEALQALPPDERNARLRQAHGATHLVSASLSRGPGQLRLDFDVAGPEGTLRRRRVVAPDVPALARAAAADLGVSLGQSGDTAPLIEDSFANEAYLRGLALRMQGDMPGAQRYFQLALEQAPDAFWPRLQLANGLLELGDIATAREQLEMLLAEADQGGDTLQRLSARNQLATLHWRAGDNALARPLLEQALALARELGDPDAEVSVLSRLGILETYSESFAAARGHLTAAIEVQRRTGMETPSPELRHSQGQLALREGDLVSASAHIEAAVAGFRLQGNRRSEAVALNSLANLRRRQGWFEEARDLAQETVSLHRALRNPTSEVAALIALSTSQAQLGDLETASETAREALALATELKQGPRQASAASLLGQYSVDLGRHADARRYLTQAMELMAVSEDPIGVQRQRLWLARLAAAEGDRPRAEREAKALLASIPPEGSDTMRLDVMRNLGMFRLEAGDAAGARAWFEQALAVAQAMDDPRRSAQLHAWLAQTWVDSGDLAAAERELALSAPELAGDPLQFQVEAALLAARGDAAGALAREEAGRIASGQRWQASDQARLDARKAATR